MNRLLHWLAVPLALAWLHAVATLPLSGGMARMPRELATVSVDLLLLLTVGVIGGAARWHRAASWCCTLLLVVGLLLRGGDAMSRAAFDRSLQLPDLMLLPTVCRMWWEAIDPADRWYALALRLLQFGVLSAATYCSFRAIAARARQSGFAVASLGVLAIATAVGIGARAHSTAAAARWRSSDLLKLADEVVRTTSLWIDPSGLDRRVLRGLERMAGVPGDLDRLQGVDVHLLVIESYGRVAWRQPALARPLRELWAELGPGLRASGFDVRTGVLAPTIRGGGSWLAHAELLTSVMVPDQATCDHVLGSEIVPLTRRFGDAGYRVVEVMPAMNVHWPEGEAFYGIDEHVTLLEFDYRGFRYPFAHVPDQFAMHHVLERIVEPAQQPLLVSFISATSHAPWAKIPPYVDDWVIDADTFAGGPAVDFNVTYDDIADTEKLLPAFSDSLGYALRCAAGYMRRLPRPSLVFVMGDHQPMFTTSVVPPDPSCDVPVHVLCNRPGLLDAIDELEFHPGFEVPEDLEALPLMHFGPMLLRLFSREH